LEAIALLKNPMIFQPDISPYLQESTQLITVKARSWNGPVAELQLFERTDNQNAWISINTFEVVIGKNGLACGQSLIPVPAGTTVFKKEGDHKSPAGLFGLSFAFGYTQNTESKINWPYLPLNDNFRGVDDPESLYYNCIVDETKIKLRDWQSSETMLRADGLYKWGLVIDYNLRPCVKGAGSQIFMHIWRGAGIGTEGCTAMPEERMLEILRWIDGGRNPLLWVY
jgi:L,D-peptidoglycan transpeptidase YkuD (ErfK/YbiS/YcfS/YnhG family)